MPESPQQPEQPAPAEHPTGTPKPGAEKAARRTTVHTPNRAELERYYHARQSELESERMRFQFGWLARLIGGKDNAPNNIAFVIVTLLLVSGVVVNFVSPADRLEYWKVILPILTLTLGYLFGKNSKD
ncbi:MAG: hypothetical protein K2V38_02445 [Gemmataceae bacterium]|nr:hypothetical protein [Gemmataceae bacterium]